MSKQVERLPYPLSKREAQRAQTFAPQGREADFAIGGIPFRLDTSNDIPMRIETEDIRKQQIDTQREPGEQSLSSWWRRSQDSFHEGAGALYQENREDQSVETFRFWDSQHVDVFTPGKISLLRKMIRNDVAGGARRVRAKGAAAAAVNLVTNPRPAVSVDGYEPNKGGASQPPVVTLDSPNTWAKIVWPADDSGGGTDPYVLVPTGTLTIGTTYTFSCKVWNSTAGTSLKIQAAGLQSSAYTGSAEWHTMSFTFTCGALTDKVRIIGSDPVAGRTTWVTECILNEGTEPIPYFDGDTDMFCYWSGEPNASTSIQADIVGAGSRWVTFASGNTLQKIFVGSTSPTIEPEVVWDAGAWVADGFMAGGKYYYTTYGGTLGIGAVDSEDNVLGSPTTWPLSGGRADRIQAMKYRLWVIGGRSIYQPDESDAGGTTQQPVFTHPNAGFRYTSMAEGPAAVYFAGNDGIRSVIHAITVDDSGGTTTLSGAITVATFPDGEIVNEIAVLGGQYMAIGTTSGLRMGVLQGDQLVYGPLFLAPERVAECTALTTQSRFFVAAFRVEGDDARPVAWRIDTSMQTADGEFAYARDVEGSGPAFAFGSLAAVGDLVVATDWDGRLYHQLLYVREEQGWLQTGRIRFSTNEAKNFATVAVDTAPLVGGMAVSALDQADVEHTIFTYGPKGKVTDTAALGVELHHQRHMSLKFYFTQDDEDFTVSPELHSYLVRALPAVEPSFTWQLPLMCYDHETSESGQEYGRDGYALERLQAIHDIERQGEVVTVQDFATNTSFQAVIDKSLFVQSSPGSSQRGKSGRGGMLVLNLRTV